MLCCDNVYDHHAGFSDNIPDLLFLIKKWIGAANSRIIYIGRHKINFIVSGEICLELKVQPAKDTGHIVSKQHGNIIKGNHVADLTLD